MSQYVTLSTVPSPDAGTQAMPEGTDHTDRGL
jgi:hypothetical protein